MLIVFGAYGVMPLLENISDLKSNNTNEEEDFMDGYQNLFCFIRNGQTFPFSTIR